MRPLRPLLADLPRRAFPRGCGPLRGRGGLLAGVAWAAAGCAKAPEAAPAPYVEMVVQGQRVVFDPASATGVFARLGPSARFNNILELSARSADGQDLLLLSVFAANVETPRAYAGADTVAARVGSSYFVYSPTYVPPPACGPALITSLHTFDTRRPGPFRLVLEQVDAATHTVSGTFAGTYYLACDSLSIRQGRFRIPYTERP